jgi:hypothetical protein
MVVPVGTFATGAATAEGRLNVPLGGQSTTRRRYSRGTPSTLREYPARGIFSSASCTARCCSGRGSRGSRPRFDPRVVICVAPAPADAGDRPAWVELALRPGRPARVRAGGSCTTRCSGTCCGSWTRPRSWPGRTRPARASKRCAVGPIPTARGQADFAPRGFSELRLHGILKSWASWGHYA